VLHRVILPAPAAKRARSSWLELRRMMTRFLLFHQTQDTTRRGYYQLVVDLLLLGVYSIAMPIILAGAAYGFMWTVLCLFRFVPMIGRKHRHSDWDQLNK
jgi:hypothetical protein